MGAALVAALALLAANAWFVALEFALIASRRTQVESQADAGGRAAVVALEAIDGRQEHLAGAQLGITMASLGLGAVAEPAVAHLIESGLHRVVHLGDAALHTTSFVIALAIVVLAHMILGEMVPKNIAIAGPERTLLVMARADRLYQRAVRPVVALLNGTANLLVRAAGIDPRGPEDGAHTAGELATMIEASREEGLLDDLAHELLTGALGFAELTVRSVLVPRDEVTSVGRSATCAQVAAAMRVTGHSRLPVVRGDLDDVAGFVHVKDLLALPADRDDRPLPAAAVRQMLVVGIDDPLEIVLRRMRRSRVHFALAHGPDGSSAGIVTLEDLLEELVGEIVDEHDRER